MGQPYPRARLLMQSLKPADTAVRLEMRFICAALCQAPLQAQHKQTLTMPLLLDAERPASPLPDRSKRMGNQVRAT